MIFRFAPLSHINCYDQYVLTQVDLPNGNIIIVAIYVLDASSWQLSVARDVDALRAGDGAAGDSSASGANAAASSLDTASQPQATAVVAASTTLETNGGGVERALKDVRGELRMLRRALGDLVRDADIRAREAAGGVQAGQVCACARGYARVLLDS